MKLKCAICGLLSSELYILVDIENKPIWFHGLVCPACGDKVIEADRPRIEVLQ